MKGNKKKKTNQKAEIKKKRKKPKKTEKKEKNANDINDNINYDNLKRNIEEIKNEKML